MKEKAKLISEIFSKELFALNMYSLLFNRLDQSFPKKRLQPMIKNHDMAVRFWERQLRIYGVKVQAKRRLWELFASCIIYFSFIIGHKYTLKALKIGEAKCLKLYLRLHCDKTLTLYQRDFIVQKLIPMQRQHLQNLMTLLKNYSNGDQDEFKHRTSEYREESQRGR